MQEPQTSRNSKYTQALSLQTSYLAPTLITIINRTNKLPKTSQLEIVSNVGYIQEESAREVHSEKTNKCKVKDDSLSGTMIQNRQYEAFVS